MKIIKIVRIHKDYYSDYNLSTFFAIGVLKQQIPRSGADINLLNAAVFHYTNYERSKLNVPICKFHEKLLATSMLHSQQMKLHKFFDHENHYDNRYKMLTNRLESVKTNSFKGFWSAGENIADYPTIKANEEFIVKQILGNKRYFSADGTHEISPYSYYEFAKVVVEGWMNSPGHRKNILNPDYKYLGCSCVEYRKIGNNGFVSCFKLTQNFGGELCLNPLQTIKSVIQKIKETVKT